MSLTGCGSRGDPLPPIYPNPPAIAGLTAAQRGAFAILRFPQPPLAARVGSEDVELEAVEVLVFAERYPPLTVEALIAGLQRRRDVMVADAAVEAEAAQARAAAEAALAAGESPPPPDDPDAPATTVPRRTPDEDLINRLPRELRDKWRLDGLSAEAELNAAQRLVDAVDALWTRLNLPATVLASGQPQPLPSSGEIAEASAQILRAATYERQLPVSGFLGRASISRRVPVDQMEGLLVDDMLQVAIPVGTAAAGDLRTRYFFAVRGSSTRQTPGEVTTLVALAPTPVPVPPDGMTVGVGPNGVELSWDPPAGDLALRRLDADSIRYNVYRLLPDGIAGPQPLNAAPTSETAYTDSGMQWGETYVYEVRALPDVEGAVRRESEGLKTGLVQAIDIYPPGTRDGGHADSRRQPREPALERFRVDRPDRIPRLSAPLSGSRGADPLRPHGGG